MATIAEALTIAVSHHRRGELAQAEHVYQQVLEAEPNQPDALHLMGVVHSQRGRHDLALDYIGRAIRIRPNDAAFYGNLGVAYRGLGKWEEAAASCRQALQIAPRFADGHYNLGLALKGQGELDQAIICFRNTLEIEPHRADVLNSLGNSLLGQGKLDDAASCYQKAQEARPDFVQAWVNLGVARRAQGRLEEAFACLRRAIELRPDYAEAHHALGNVLKTAGQLDEAVASYRRAIHFKPSYAKAHNSLGNAYRDQDQVDEAAACYQQALAIEPKNPLLELRLSTLCPAVLESSEAIDRFREQLLAKWRQLAEGNLKIDLRTLGVSASEPPTGIQYHGRDDRPLKEAFASIFRGCFAGDRPRAGTGRPRIGFVVTARHEAAFLASMRGVLEYLTPGKFDLVVICQPLGEEPIRSAFSGRSVRVLVVPERLDLIVEQVRAVGFDVLYHWEVGTDATNYFLPFCRLAPVQCTSWGQPETSGVAQIDYYLSSALAEPDDGARSHYTERLLIADTLLSYQRRTRLPESPKRREAFGFTSAQHVFLCAQQIRKFHPHFDAILGEILRRDAQGLIVVVEDRYGRAAAELRQRLAAAVPDVRDRIVFLPRQSYPDYLSLVAASDVLLDPLHFGGGFTTYQGFALGKPIVTLPAAFLRGRYTFGCYRKMDLNDCVAFDPDDYVKIAVRLAQDEGYRAAVEGSIRAASACLFEDIKVAEEHERFFEQMVDEARSNPPGAAGYE